jgi:hypothetical protein
LILTLLAALGIGTSALNRSNAPPASSGQSISNPLHRQGAGLYAHSAAQLLENFFDTNPEQVKGDKPWLRNNAPSVTENNSFPESDGRKQFAISFLIATVPAPVSPSLRHEFDSYVDAIQLAVGRAGYVLDSFDLPWLPAGENRQGELRISQEIDAEWADETQAKSIAAKRRSGTRPPTSSAPHGHVLKFSPNSQDETRVERDPAIILFRDDGNKRLLVVFLVGETPTRGVNKTALRDALDEIAWLSRWKLNDSPPPQYLTDGTCLTKGPSLAGNPVDPCPNRHEIRIVGPSFSGSAASIRNTLTEWLDVQGNYPVKIHIVSGTATAVGDQLDIQPDESTRVDFHSMRIPDHSIWDFALRRFLLAPALPFLRTRRDPNHPDVAVLSDDTLYGASPISGVMRITFPVHISELRTAVGRTNQASPPIGPDIGRHDIPIADESNQQQRDVIPLFSGRSAAYDELVIENLLATLSREHIRYVGIVASDVEDLVFLVHEIHRACPNTVVFTIASDLRYLHTDVNPDLVGMLVFSTYPLFSENQDWTYPFLGSEQRLQFPGEDAEGIFNATVVQLGREDKIVEYGSPFAVTAAVGPHNSTTPALWVGIVGRDNIWPIDFEPLDGSIENLYYAQVSRASHADAPWVKLGNLYPLPFLIAFLVLCVACLIPCMGIVWPALVTQAKPPSGSTRPWTETLLGEAVFPELLRERRMRVNSFLGALLLEFIVGAGIFLLPIKSAISVTGVSLKSLSLPVLLATFAIIPTTLIVIVAALRRSIGSLLSTVLKTTANRDKHLHPTGAWFALLSTMVGVVLVTWFVRHEWRLPAPVAILSFIRTANLGNGVSPLKPLIFLGIANLWLIGGDLWRLRLLEDCRVKPPFLNFEAGAESFRGIDALEARVIDFLECSPWELPGAPVVALLLVSFLYFASGRGLPVVSIDGWAFFTLFTLSAMIIYFYFSILLLRFVWVWIGVHRLLRRLYWHQTRNAYALLRVKSLPDESANQTIRLLEPVPSLTAIEFSLQCAREILRMLDEQAGKAWPASGTFAAASPGIRKDLEQTIRSAERGVAYMLEAQNKPDWRCAIIRRVETQDLIACLAYQIARLFEPAWRMIAQHLPPALSDDDRKLLEQGNLFVAARVVDFLRQVFPQMRVLSGTAMTGVLAMMLAASAYPFVQRDTLLWLSWLVLLTVIAIGVIIFVQISRSRIISMLYGTTPGHFNWDGAFTVRILMFGVIPILTLLGAQFPNALGGIMSWIGRLFGGGTG